jgi:catechol 2,3-dioxygenase
MDTATTSYQLNKSLALGPVELTVADLGRSVEYYQNAIGMRLLARGDGSAQLGVPGRPFVALGELPGAVSPPPSSPGLSHVAPLVPTCADVARFAEHYAGLEREMSLVNHIVAWSCYVFDPDGHCIEITATRPREEWRWQDGLPVLVADPLTLADFRDEPGATLPFEGLPAGTELDHVQLKVTDAGLTASEAFYCDVLGFKVAGRIGTFFLGVGVADFNGVLVLTNRFSPEGSEPAPDNSARLLGVDLLLPAARDVQGLAERLATAGYPHDIAANVLTVDDPSGNTLRFKATPTADAA